MGTSTSKARAQPPAKAQPHTRDERDQLRQRAAGGAGHSWEDMDFRLRPPGKGYVPVRTYQVPADRHE
jgi:hypothetical protein